jgi:glycosyltransferase involved in cell wall biosynthesis
LLTREPPDVVHVMSCPQFAPALRRALPTAALVLHLHDALHLRLPAALAGQRLARFGAVATCSPWLEQSLRERFPRMADCIHHVGNGVDLAAFTPAPLSARTDSDKTLLFVGRISPEKGVHVLVDAFAMLRERFRDLHLELVGAPGLLPLGLMRLIGLDEGAGALAYYGAGPLGQIRAQILSGGRGYLEALQARLPPTERGALHVRGSLPHDRLPEVYRAAAVLVMPSVCEEPFPLPAAEAMACGLPVVATRSGGLSGLVEHGVSGLLVERGDVVGLSEAIANLLEAPELRASMATAARARAERLFGWERAARRLMDLSEQVAAWSPQG